VLSIKSARASISNASGGKLLKTHKSEKTLKGVLKRGSDPINGPPANTAVAASTPSGTSSKNKFKFGPTAGTKENDSSKTNSSSVKRNSALHKKTTSVATNLPTAFKSKVASTKNPIEKSSPEAEIANSITPHLEKLLEDVSNSVSREYENNQGKLTNFLTRIYQDKITKAEEISKRYEADLRRLEQLIDPCKLRRLIP
jgi:hypothetical protein